ncbi:hypothetical protein HYY71_01060 [Candidatus Woesearchaeota archaeon]|nr:hypothetical protein [Candidatus Woesearchaeota archaeon]
MEFQSIKDLESVASGLFIELTPLEKAALIGVIGHDARAVIEGGGYNTSARMMLGFDPQAVYEATKPLVDKSPRVAGRAATYLVHRLGFPNRHSIKFGIDLLTDLGKGDGEIAGEVVSAIRVSDQLDTINRYEGVRLAWEKIRQDRPELYGGLMDEFIKLITPSFITAAIDKVKTPELMKDIRNRLRRYERSGDLSQADKSSFLRGLSVEPFFNILDDIEARLGHKQFVARGYSGSRYAVEGLQAEVERTFELPRGSL